MRREREGQREREGVERRIKTKHFTFCDSLVGGGGDFLGGSTGGGSRGGTIRSIIANTTHRYVIL